MSKGGRLLQLGPKDAKAALRFCQTKPESTLWIAGWIGDGGLSASDEAPEAWLLGEFDRRDALTGLAYLSASGVVLPILRAPETIKSFPRVLKSLAYVIRVLIGPSKTVQEIWGQLASFNLRPRIVRDQVGYLIDHRSQLIGDDPLELRPARTKDLDQLVRTSASMAREEVGDDPYARNPELFGHRIRQRVQRGRDMVHTTERGELVFKSNVAALSGIGGQIEGIYTEPKFRNQGFGRRGTLSVTQWVLARAPSAFLLVNDSNHTARRMYEKMGYRPAIHSRTIYCA